MKAPILPILLTGGSGSRLWPVSRESMPKQFLPLFGDLSTYQQTLARVSNPDLFTSPIIMTAKDFRFFVRQQASDMGVKGDIVLEPVGRDSGPAIVAAAILAQKKDPQALLLVLAADHIISDTELFYDACRTARDAAEKGSIVVFGIRPSEPKTSFGYVRKGHELSTPGTYSVDAFVEKPDYETARRYIQEGYLWNSGNFLFRADIFLAEVAEYEPDMLEAVQESVDRATEDLGFMCLEKDSFSRAPQKSIDYAIMERTKKAAMVEGLFNWSDIGTWEGIYQSVEKDASNNASRGNAIMLDAENCLVHADGRLTALLGVKNLAVITTPDAVLVVSRERANDVKKLVGLLKDAGHKEAKEHRRIYRPWGYFESIDFGDRFQVKRIVVTPGATLSLQKHLHRAEHWVVVRGVAEVTIDGETKLIHENESMYVPMTAVHRLANPGKIPLELIEVQTGSYLGEDDITRLADVYNRDKS